MTQLTHCTLYTFLPLLADGTNGRAYDCSRPHLHVLRMKLWRFCVEKHQTSFLQICGLQTVHISIQLRYEIWSVMHRRVYQRKIRTIDELKQRLIEVLCGLEQSTVDMAVDQWRKRLRACVRTKGEDTSNIVFELNDCLDFVNFLSPSLSCFA